MMKPKYKLPFPQSPDSGFTIIECLLAILIVSLLMVAIAPAIVLSVATRVQARRVELATTAARTYIDGVRTRTIQPPSTVSAVPEKERLFTNTFVPTGVAGPSATLPACPLPANNPRGYYCNPLEEAGTAPATTAPTSLYCINLDGNGCESSRSRNLVVQAFRSVTFDTNSQLVSGEDLQKGTAGYVLGVRVYRLDAFNGTGAPLKTMAGTGGKKVSTFAMGGLGYRVGESQAPLVELTTEIAPQGTSYERFKARLGVQTPPVVPGS